MSGNDSLQSKEPAEANPNARSTLGSTPWLGVARTLGWAYTIKYDTTI